MFTDIGVLPVSTFGGNRYFVIFVDEYTRFVEAFLMKQRSQLYEVYERLKVRVKTKLQYLYQELPVDDDRIKQIQSDNAKD